MRACRLMPASLCARVVALRTPNYLASTLRQRARYRQSSATFRVIVAEPVPAWRKREAEFPAA